MPNFKEFIKGFEEKPEQPMQEQPKPFKVGDIVSTKQGKKFRVENPDDAQSEKTWGNTHTFAQEIDEKGNEVHNFGSRAYIPNDQFEKPQPKENRDQIIEKVNQKMMNANTYGAFGDKENYEKSIAEAEELRKGLAPKAEPKRPMTNKEIRDEHLKIKEKMDEKEKELGRKVNKEEYDEILNEVRNAPQPKQGSFEQVFGEPKPLSKEDLKKADIAAEWIDSAYGYDGWRAEKLPNGNFLTNVHTQDPDAEPEEVSPEVFVEQFKELLDNEDEGFIDFLNSEHGYNIPVTKK